MLRALITLGTLFLTAASAAGQPAPIKDPLLEHLAGTWVLRGTIAGQQTTHDVTVEWMLGHQYLRIHETSREKDGGGQPQYEALVIVGWDAASAEYQCLWLDTTGGGGLVARSIGHGKRRDDNAVPFLFRSQDGSVDFSNTFSYDTSTDSWTWRMDNVQKGKATSFGLVRLTRK